MKSYVTMVVIAILALLSALVVVSASGTEGELSPASQAAADETTIQDLEDLIEALEIKLNALESEIFGSSGYSGNPLKTNSIEGWIINLDQRVTDLESQLDAR